jgi:pimeloyl-ACP methyl ester carboxylesterase
LPAIFSGDLSSLAYSIEDMADDVGGLIEVLGLGAAHVVGISMGGMIAQALAIRHPARVRSLASIMSTTGDRSVGRPSPEALAVVMRPPSRDREANIEGGVGAWRALRSPGYPFDEQAVRAFVARAFDRCFYPKGAARQMAAIGSQRDRTEALGRIVVDTVVLHGAEDPLVNVSGGEATARAIEGARLVVVPGMGHDMPAGVWPIVLDAIATNAARR